MDNETFERYAELAYKKAGIRLRDGKEALVAARVAKRMRVLGMGTAKDYLDYLENDASGDELIQFLDVISTNFTSFFREPVHFSVLSTFVTERVRAGRQRLRFWSAASSSGEEPYTMAITIAEAVGSASVDWRILATDISTRVLERAQLGIYPETALRPVPAELRERYFGPAGTARDGERLFSVARTLRPHIVYKRLNLTEERLPMRGPLDVVFCRNVMIYFDGDTRATLIRKIEELLAPDGMLLIGHSESLAGLDTRLRSQEPAVYQLSDSHLHGASRNQTGSMRRAHDQ
jgi:chemotaxis protein methyltransferase CheR